MANDLTFDKIVSAIEDNQLHAQVFFKFQKLFSKKLFCSIILVEMLHLWLKKLLQLFHMQP